MATDAGTAVAPALPGPMLPVRYRVSGRDQETADAVTLSLTAVDEPIGEPQPGQFTMMYAFGVGEVPISVSGCPGVEGEPVTRSGRWARRRERCPNPAPET